MQEGKLAVEVLCSNTWSMSDEHGACIYLNTCSKLKLLALLEVNCFKLSNTLIRGNAMWFSLVFRLFMALVS